MRMVALGLHATFSMVEKIDFIWGHLPVIPRIAPPDDFFSPLSLVK
jgi:hypothetical protein